MVEGEGVTSGELEDDNGIDEGTRLVPHRNPPDLGAMALVAERTSGGYARSYCNPRGREGLSFTKTLPGEEWLRGKLYSWRFGGGAV